MDPEQNKCLELKVNTSRSRLGLDSASYLVKAGVYKLYIVYVTSFGEISLNAVNNFFFQYPLVKPSGSIKKKNLYFLWQKWFDNC